MIDLTSFVRISFPFDRRRQMHRRSQRGDAATTGDVVSACRRIGECGIGTLRTSRLSSWSLPGCSIAGQRSTDFQSVSGLVERRKKPVGRRQRRVGVSPAQVRLLLESFGLGVGGTQAGRLPCPRRRSRDAAKNATKIAQRITALRAALIAEVEAFAKIAACFLTI